MCNLVEAHCYGIGRGGATLYISICFNCYVITQQLPRPYPNAFKMGLSLIPISKRIQCEHAQRQKNSVQRFSLSTVSRASLVHYSACLHRCKLCVHYQVRDTRRGSYRVISSFKFALHCCHSGTWQSTLYILRYQNTTCIASPIILT